MLLTISGGAPWTQAYGGTRSDGRLLSTFVAIGDAGGGDHQLGVAHAIDQWAADGHRVDALVSVGDNVTPDGDPNRYPAQLDRPYASLRTTRPFWVTLGNHDEREGHGPEQLAYLHLPSMPYEKHLAGATLLFLDSHRATADAGWLESHLRLSRDPFQIVIVHHPPYSCLPHAFSAEMDQAWRPTLDTHRTPLVLSGHDHMYERFISTRGTTFVVTGGGGSRLHRLGSTCPTSVRLLAMRSLYHFTYVRVYEHALRLSIVGADGHTADAFTIHRLP